MREVAGSTPGLDFLVQLTSVCLEYLKVEGFFLCFALLLQYLCGIYFSQFLRQFQDGHETSTNYTKCHGQTRIETIAPAVTKCDVLTANGQLQLMDNVYLTQVS
jgi:hypothetical protein